eukprot:g8710.t1
MSDLLTSLQQQIEQLSTALCQIPGTLYLKSTSESEIKDSVDVSEGIPDIQPISNKLAALIEALPSMRDFEDLPEKKERIVKLWTERNTLDEQLDEATELLQKLHSRLTVLHEALVINTPSTSKKRKTEGLNSDEEALSDTKKTKPSKESEIESADISPQRTEFI